MKEKRHINIPIFIPHLGCKNQCVFCNQRTISGVKEFDISKVTETIEQSLKTVNANDECEIAFFGGSFTGIDRDLMIKLLFIANQYIKQGRISSIRCSTRPDYIDNEILNILKSYGVKTIELGLQSVSDDVLKITKRGHTGSDEYRAAELILKHGFTLGGQMMIGLPGSTLNDEILTAKEIIKMGASEARIYPTIVFHKTELCQMTMDNSYTPLSIDDAIFRSAYALELFLDAGVRVLRIGLCESEGLYDEDSYYSGPMHPALGELVFSEYYYRKIKKAVLDMEIPRGSSITVSCKIGETSKIIGHKAKNKAKLERELGIKIYKVKENFVNGYDVAVMPN